MGCTIRERYCQENRSHSRRPAPSISGLHQCWAPSVESTSRFVSPDTSPSAAGFHCETYNPGKGSAMIKQMLERGELSNGEQTGIRRVKGAKKLRVRLRNCRSSNETKALLECGVPANSLQRRTWSRITSAGARQTNGLGLTIPSRHMRTRLHGIAVSSHL